MGHGGWHSVEPDNVIPLLPPTDSDPERPTLKTIAAATGLASGHRQPRA
jgi:hypothetical protein